MQWTRYRQSSFEGSRDGDKSSPCFCRYHTFLCNEDMLSHEGSLDRTHDGHLPGEGYGAINGEPLFDDG